MTQRTTRARAASNSRWTDARVLAPSRLVLGEVWLWLSWVHASPAPSLQKNFREDENLFFRSVTGLAIVGMARGHCNESAEGALWRTSLPHCNVGCAGRYVPFQKKEINASMDAIQLKARYFEIYKPIARKFIQDVKGLNYNNIPEPHFPVFGTEYVYSNPKIIFIGIDTLGYGKFEDFYNLAINNIEEALSSEFEEFNSLKYLEWVNNFGNDFWAFILKFLANYNDIDDWTKLKSGKYISILKSFVWANSNSIQTLNLDYSKIEYNDYLKIKKLSSPFDNVKILVDTFGPDLIIILNWSIDEKYLLTDYSFSFHKDIIEDHLYVYSNTDYLKAKVIWTSHPNWLNKNYNFDDYIKKMVLLSKKILNE